MMMMMMMTRGVRRLALTAHVVVSVGWLGAVAGFLALAIAGVASDDAQLVRAAYLGMDVTASFVIVPLGAGALVTGIVQAVGTKWGLFRHYWIIAKLSITTVATVLLLVHTRLIHFMRTVAAESTLAAGDFRSLRVQLVATAAGAVLALIVATTLAVYKPRGLTRYGWRRSP